MDKIKQDFQNLKEDVKDKYNEIKIQAEEKIDDLKDRFDEMKFSNEIKHQMKSEVNDEKN